MRNLLTVRLRGLRGADGGTTAPAARRAKGIEARLVLLAVVACVAVLALGAASAQALPRGGGSSRARPAADSSPTIDNEFNSNTLSTSTQLNAQINPDGLNPTCEFQYVDDTDFQATGFAGASVVTVPCSPASLGSGTTDVTAIAQIGGLTPSTLYDFRAVVNAGEASEVDGADTEFFTAPAASIDSLSASNIGPNGAELDTQINPEGTDTTCTFEYVDDTDFQSTGFTGPNVVSQPCSPADLGAGTTDQLASLQVTGLTPSTTYDFEVIATNANTGPNGVSNSSSFTTTAPVTVDAESVSGITSTTATLNAQLNPNGLDTTYQFVVTGPGGFSETVPTNPVDVGSGTTGVGAAASLSGLTPGTTYTYHVTATNSAGTSVGTDQTFTTFPSSQSSGIPDGRGYEQVTPANKDNGEVYLRAGEILGPTITSSTGNSLSWFSLDALPGSKFDGAFYVTDRGSNSWITTPLIPPQGPEESLLCATIAPEAVDYSSDLSTAVLADGVNQPSCSADDPPLVPGEPTGNQNLFVVGGGSPLLVDPAPVAGGTPQQATFDGASSNLSTVVFDEPAQLTSDAPGSGTDDLYASAPSATANPTVKLVTVLPDGTPVAGTLAGAGAGTAAGSNGDAFGAISADGSKVFFTATPTDSDTTNLYVRENPMSSSASTTQVDSGIGGGGVFLAATSDGSNVYFMDSAGNNLYDYNTTTNHLTDLTPGGSAGIAGLAGLNSTGSGLYVVATSVLASNPNSFGQAATSGSPNLYLIPNGDQTKTTFIATLNGNDTSDWSPNSLSSRVSANGSFIAFTTQNALNTSQPTTTVPNQIYVFNAGTGKLNCASCAPGGAAASAGAKINSPYTAISATSGFVNGEFLQQYVSNTGQVFFDTPDALLPAVQNNGVSDVYEWEANGTGTCASTTDNGGCLSLLSGGSSPYPSFFADASPSGNDVFFATFNQLVAQDTDLAGDYYDARVDGGFPATAPPPTCQGDGCKPPESATPPVPVVATVTFFGPGNVRGSTTSSSPKKKSKKKKKKHALIAVLTQRISGNQVKVRITVPARGRLSVAGAGLTGSSRYVRHAGAYTLMARLKPRAMAALETKHKLRLTIRVRYVPAGGHASAAVIKLTVKA